MKKTNTISMFTLIIILIPLIGYADFPVEIKIDSMPENIGIGEPLILKVISLYEEPQLSENSGDILNSLSEELAIGIYYGKELSEPIYTSRDHILLYPEDDKGLYYSGNIVLLYDTYKNKLIFDSQGIYKVTVRRTNTITSEPLEIDVKPTSSNTKEMLSLLSDKDDFNFISYGSQTYFEKKSERIEVLKKIIDNYKNTKLAQMAAAQLGLKYFEKFRQKYPSFEQFKTEYQAENFEEPLFEQSSKYLRIGATLPDEFPIRPEVLLQLSRVEYMEDNLNKTISLVDEIATKYPNTKYGRQAVEAQKTEITKLKTEIEQASTEQIGKQDKSPEKKPLIFIAFVVGVTFAGLFIAGIILFSKKKKAKVLK